MTPRTSCWRRRAARFVAALLLTLAVVPMSAGAVHAREISGGALLSIGADGGAPVSIGAVGAVLWDPADDRILWGRDARTARPMASTTKIMTALLAVEAGTIDETVTVSAQAARVGRIPDGASLGLTEGQQLSMQELLAGLMLRSGNDAAVAVAEHVATTEQAFVAMMNARAQELGLADTHFLNASGLTDDPRHHASPLDLARLAEVALAEPDIARWAAADTLDTTAFGLIENRNELIVRYEGATGLKTGFTSLAGRCLVATAERNGRELISVVLGSDDHFADSTDVLDHGYDDFRRLVVDPDDRIGTWRSSAGAVPLLPAAMLARTVPASADVTVRVSPEPVIASGVAAGEELGDVELLVDDQVVATSTAVAGAGIASSPTDVGEALQDGLRGLARLAHWQLRGEPSTMSSN